MKAFTEKQRVSFDDLKLSLPEEQMKMAEIRIPELQAMISEMIELIE